MDTLLEAVVLVVIVILVFLQKWRAAIIQVLAITMSLIGTSAVLAADGYSIHNLSQFGNVFAIGIVVEQSIVFVENVGRHIQTGVRGVAKGADTREEGTG